MNYHWPLMKDIVTQEDRMAMIRFLTQDLRLTAGEQVREFEEAFRFWLNEHNFPCHKNAIFVQSGSQANLLLFAALMDAGYLKPGDKVIVPTITWGTTLSPLKVFGLEPLWVDIDHETFTMNLEQIEEHADDAQMLWITHLAGLPVNMHKVREMIEGRNILVAEDCCQSYGARCAKNEFGEKGQMIGTFGIASTFSFYFGHHMTTIEGGMLVVDTETTLGSHLFDIAQSMRSHGLTREIHNKQYKDEIDEANPEVDNRFLFAFTPFNMRNTELNAVLGQEQLERLDSFIAERNENWWKFSDAMQILEGIADAPKQMDGCTPSSFCLPLTFKTVGLRNKFLDLAEEAGFETRPLAGGVLIDTPAFRDWDDLTDHDFDSSWDLYSRTIYIGNNHMIDSENWIQLYKLFNTFKESL